MFYGLKVKCEVHITFNHMITFIFICDPHPFVCSLKRERFYLHFCNLHCQVIKKRLANDFLIANVYQNMMFRLYF